MTIEVELHGPLQQITVHLFNPHALRKRSGIADQHIDTPEVTDTGLDSCLDRGVTGNITDHTKHAVV